MLTLLLTAALASTVDLAPVRDNSIYSESSSLSNGAGVDVFAGRTAVGSRRRALVAFDLTGIPAGSVVSSATLHFTLTLAPPTMDTQNVAIHRLVASWGEAGSVALPPGGMGVQAEPGDATWGMSSYPERTWTTAGGDFAASASAVTSVGVETDVDYAWGSTAAMVADVQAWVDNPDLNHGWILIGNEAGSTTARRFASRENTTEAIRPRLVVEYTAPSAGPGAVPDGGARPGAPLKVSRSGGSLSLTWGASCRPAADYVVQAGTLASVRAGTYNDVPLACTTAGQTSFTTAAPAADSYFLVLPLGGSVVGSRGLDGDGVERPLGTTACAPASPAAPVCP